MRVLFFTLEYAPGLAGGAERQARLQAEELVRRGHRVSVVCPRSHGQRSGVVHLVRVTRLPRSRRPRLRKLTYALVLSAWLVVRGRRFDIWHIHLASRQADWVVLMAGLLRRPTYVKVASGGATGEVRLGGGSAWLTRRIGLRGAGRVQALSGEIAAELQGIGVAADRIIRIPNGLDLSVFQPPTAHRRSELRGQLGLPERSPVVLFVGRFAEYKGVGDLLRAWDEVARHVDGVLVLVGARGREDRPLAMPVAGPRVLIRPWTSDVVAYLQAADVFAYPPHQDGMSNALLEAMACGLPPVATNIPAVQGLLVHERNALLIAPAAPAELAAALLRFLRNGPVRRRLGLAASQTARRYAVQDVVSEIEHSYRQLV